MMGAPASFHDDLRAREIREERDHLRATEIRPQHRPSVLVDDM
jgi:hypothetical protein